MGILLGFILSYQVNFRDEVKADYNYTKPLIENTSKAVAENDFEPEIPEEDTNELQVSCETSTEYLISHPDEVRIFLEKLDSLIDSKPYLMNLLIALLTSDRSDIQSYLQTEYSGGFPNP